MSDRSGILTEQKTQGIFLLLDLLFELRNLRRGGVLQLFSLAQIGERHRTAALQRGGELHRFLPRLQCFLGDIQLLVVARSWKTAVATCSTRVMRTVRWPLLRQQRARAASVCRR